jgi:hypothetical protein
MGVDMFGRIGVQDVQDQRIADQGRIVDFAASGSSTTPRSFTARRAQAA